jgi:hypothetical protein
MRAMWYLVSVCDGCGLRAECAPPAPDQAEIWKQPPPEGWYSTADPMGWQIRNPMGWQPGDLCPDCIALPFTGLIEKIRNRCEELASGKRD